jgi:hypothetical protein
VAELISTHVAVAESGVDVGTVPEVVRNVERSGTVPYVLSFRVVMSGVVSVSDGAMGQAYSHYL